VLKQNTGTPTSGARDADTLSGARDADTLSGAPVRRTCLRQSSHVILSFVQCVILSFVQCIYALTPTLPFVMRYSLLCTMRLCAYSPFGHALSFPLYDAFMRLRSSTFLPLSTIFSGDEYLWRHVYIA
jgi:hypothetical protein